MKIISKIKQENGYRRELRTFNEDKFVIVAEKTKESHDSRYQEDRICLSLAEIKKIYEEYCLK
jgi:hypothetical protein